MRLLYVPLRPEAQVELIRRATSERRRPQDEAALIIERALGLPDPHTPEQLIPPREVDNAPSA